MISCVWVFARGEGGGGEERWAFLLPVVYSLWLYLNNLNRKTQNFMRSVVSDGRVCQLSNVPHCMYCTWSPRNTYLMDLWQKAHSRTKINSIDILSLAVYNFSSLTSHLTPSSQTHCHHYVVHIINHHCKKKKPSPLPLSRLALAIFLK